MTPETAIIIGSVALLLLVSAFFSGSETALTGASHPRLLTLAKGGNRKAARVMALWGNSERTLGGILLGNNLVNILASSLATVLMIRLFGESGVAFATLGMTLLVVIFAEILPKTLALRHADTVAGTISRPLGVILTLLLPFTFAIQLIVSGLLRVLGVRTADDDGQALEETLLGAIEQHSDGSDGGSIDARNMMRSILDLDDVVVEEIMSHRKNLVTIDIGLPNAQIIAQVLESPYTRMPVWEEDSDNIIGILHAKAILRAVQAAGGDIDSIDIRELLKKPWFIPEATILLDQLKAFQKRREHFAIVVDEYGGLMGVVTLEDILEEIVGEITDETDVDVDGVYPRADGSVVVDGDVTVRDLNRRFDWQLSDEKASTIAGLVLYETRQIPGVGQVFDVNGYRFKILKRKRQQITSVSIRPR